MIGIGEARWRMLRKIMHKRAAGATFQDLRAYARQDASNLCWLIEAGLVMRTDGGRRFLVTPRGVEVADMGEMELAEYMTICKKAPQPSTAEFLREIGEPAAVEQ